MTEGIFSYRRRVAFGECDSARIYFAPRAIDYAVEAVEAWYRSVLGVSWVDLVGRRGLEATIVDARCEYKRPLIASQVVQVRVRVIGVGDTRITLSATGKGDACETYFQVRLKACFTSLTQGVPVGIPPEYFERIVAYQARCAERGGRLEETDPVDGARVRFAGDFGAATSICPDLLHSPRAGTVPFARQRSVRYGECGRSGTLYPPKLFEFIVEVIGEWFEEVVGISWLELTAKRAQGTPVVSAACRYLRPMVPGDVVTLVVRVPRLGRASIGYLVSGYAASGASCFESEVTSCFVDQTDGIRPMAIPEEFRKRILGYRAACGENG